MKVRLALLLLIAVGCSNPKEEPLPAVSQPALFEVPRACVGAPPLPPFAEPVETSAEPQACLRDVPTTPNEVTLDLTIVDGHVRDFSVSVDLEERARGVTGDLKESVRQCLIACFATWRYPVVACPGHESKSSVPIVLRPSVNGPAGALTLIRETDE